MKRWLKRLLKGGICFLASVLLSAVLVVGLFFLRYKLVTGTVPGGLPTAAAPGALGQQVNVFIGTGGIPWVCGNNHPGTMTPFGVVRLGPETVSWLNGRRATNTAGYYYGDDRLLGFSHTRLIGTGATDGGHFLVRPGYESISLTSEKPERYDRFSHANEKAFPGYYAVRLKDSGILAEMTATPRTGVHRYTFDGAKPPHLILDVSNANGGRRSSEASVRVRLETNEVEGSVRTFGTFAGRSGGIKVYFVAQFDRPFSSFATWQDGTLEPSREVAEGDDAGVDLGFAPADSVITVKLAVSHVSIENARANLLAESAEKSFDVVLQDAIALWENRLGRIAIEGGSDEQRRIFYSALYRSFQMPTVFNDVNGDYLGFDGKVHQTEGFQYYTDLSLWDTFRTVHPLFILLAPEDQRDMLVSLVKMSEQGGWLPRWPAGAGYTNSMLGTPADIVIAESYLKGIRDFDVETAYAAMRRTALEPTSNGAKFSGREGVEHYVTYGYCPADLMHEAVARTLEFAWADHAIAELASALGRSEDAALFERHSKHYRNLWNPATGYFHPRNSDGTFVEKFDPDLTTYLDFDREYTDDYVEGSAMQWRWMAPFDPEGLIDLFGSADAFVAELDAFFSLADPTIGKWNPGPYYWHGNEPDMHAAYLFNAAGRPDLTQKWVRWILDNKYKNTHYGVDGNDDAGTLSAWYVFSSLGLYPIAGTDRYELGAPLFQRAEIKMGSGTLMIETSNYGPGNFYANAVRLNGTLLDRWWVRHDEVQSGGTLEFAMAPAPVSH